MWNEFLATFGIVVFGLLYFVAVGSAVVGVCIILVSAFGPVAPAFGLGAAMIGAGVVVASATVVALGKIMYGQ